MSDMSLLRPHSEGGSVDRTDTRDLPLMIRISASQWRHSGRGRRVTPICGGSGKLDVIAQLTLAHGRIEQRFSWTSIAINDYLDFADVAQGFIIERPTINERPTIKKITRRCVGI